MNFGQALENLKMGEKVARAHWGGYWFMPVHAEGQEPIPSESLCKPFAFNTTLIVAKLKDNGGYVPATPYQEDILANDWEVIV